MKRFISIVTSCIFAMSLMACGSSDAASSASASSAASTSAEATTGEKTFKLGFDAEYPPFGYMDESGKYTGFDIELAENVCEMNGWNFKPTPINWDSKDMELNAGSIDCIWSGFTMNGREDEYTWSVPYVNNSQVIVCNENSGINSLADLEGKNVGVQAASSALDALNNDHADLVAKFATLQEFGDYNSAFVELQASSIDAVAMDIGVANYQISSRGEGYKIIEEPISVEEYGIAFKKGNDELKDTVESSIKQLVEDGTVAELAEKYEIEDLVCLSK